MLQAGKTVAAGGRKLYVAGETETPVKAYSQDKPTKRPSLRRF